MHVEATLRPGKILEKVLGTQIALPPHAAYGFSHVAAFPPPSALLSHLPSFLDEVLP